MTEHMTAGRVYFTPAQVDALAHRLEEPDMIAESLDAERGDCRVWCDALCSTLKAGGFVTLPFSETEAECLVEAVEGSTWVALHMDGMQQTPASRGAYRALKGAAEKLRAAGLEITSVPHA